MDVPAPRPPRLPLRALPSVSENRTLWTFPMGVTGSVPHNRTFIPKLQLAWQHPPRNRHHASYAGGVSGPDGGVGGVCGFGASGSAAASSCCSQITRYFSCHSGLYTREETLEKTCRETNTRALSLKTGKGIA